MVQNIKLRPFPTSLAAIEVPNNFPDPFVVSSHYLCEVAIGELKDYLTKQTDFHHNFGLKKGQKGTGDGKMFGVLVVKTDQNQIGYLCAFSGKLAGSNHHARFVPPVFDSLDENSFLNSGMIELSAINGELKELEEAQDRDENQI